MVSVLGDMEEVLPMLERLGLGKYAEAFEDEGFTDLETFLACDERQDG